MKRSSVPATLVLLLASTSLVHAEAKRDPQREAWRHRIRAIHLPKAGCFQAEYPRELWNEVPCQPPPDIRLGPKRHGPALMSVTTAAESSSSLGSAEGSFPTKSCLVAEYDSACGREAYTIQLNTDFFDTTVCAGAADPSQCFAWQQFVLSESPSGGVAFMQYWLINYGSTCPAGWYNYSGDCFKNSSATTAAALAAEDLSIITLSASAGTNDTLEVSTPSTVSVIASDSVLNLAGAWNIIEFNVFGCGSGSVANFNVGATVGVEVKTFSDTSWTTPVASTCITYGATAESSNLTQRGTCSSSSTGISFTENHQTAAANPNLCLPIFVPIL